jgi:hypothetical protein
MVDSKAIRDKGQSGGRTIGVEQVITGHARLARNASRDDNNLFGTNLYHDIE